MYKHTLIRSSSLQLFSWEASPSFTCIFSSPSYIKYLCVAVHGTELHGFNSHLRHLTSIHSTNKVGKVEPSSIHSTNILGKVEPGSIHSLGKVEPGSINLLGKVEPGSINLLGKVEPGSINLLGKVEPGSINLLGKVEPGSTK